MGSDITVGKADQGRVRAYGRVWDLMGGAQKFVKLIGMDKLSFY